VIFPTSFSVLIYKAVEPHVGNMGVALVVSRANINKSKEKIAGQLLVTQLGQN
jgi:hypothetical protein